MTREQFEPMAKCWRLRAYQVAQAFGIADEQADDIAQETLLKLWAMRDDLERYRSVDALVVVIAKHIAIDYSRRKPLVRLDEASAQLPIADNQSLVATALAPAPGADAQAGGRTQLRRDCRVAGH